MNGQKRVSKVARTLVLGPLLAAVMLGGLAVSQTPTLSAAGVTTNFVDCNALGCGTG